MENYDEKMNYSFEPAPEEPSRPPLEQAKEELRRSGTHTGLKIAALLAALEQQTAPAVLATIVGRQGSTPREEGSKMLVLPDGSAVGSVGGGIMEYRTQQLARELLEPGAAPCRLAAFTTEGASDAAAIAACGGSMEVFLQRLEPEG